MLYVLIDRYVVVIVEVILIIPVTRLKIDVKKHLIALRTLETKATRGFLLLSGEEDEIVAVAATDSDDLNAIMIYYVLMVVNKN